MLIIRCGQLQECMEKGVYYWYSYFCKGIRLIYRVQAGVSVFFLVFFFTLTCTTCLWKTNESVIKYRENNKMSHILLSRARLCRCKADITRELLAADKSVSGFFGI